MYISYCVWCYDGVVCGISCAYHVEEDLVWEVMNGFPGKVVDVLR